MSPWKKARPAMRGGLSAIALFALLGSAHVPLTAIGWSGPAWADEHGDGAGRGGNGPGPGAVDRGGGGHEDDHDDGNHEDGDHDTRGRGGGAAAGDTHDGTGSGGRGQGGDAHGDRGQGSGGSPPWASEGIPEIELGRLNVARSPDHVLDRAFAEATAQLPSMAAFYNLPLSGMVQQLQSNWDTLSIIDSPLQNLALFRDGLDGQHSLSAYGITNDRDTLMAVFVGVATDKSMPVTADSVQALSIILDMPLPPADAAAIAAEAEAIRQAVVLGHG